MHHLPLLLLLLPLLFSLTNHQLMSWYIGVCLNIYRRVHLRFHSQISGKQSSQDAACWFDVRRLDQLHKVFSEIFYVQEGLTVI